MSYLLRSMRASTLLSLRFAGVAALLVWLVPSLANAHSRSRVAPKSHTSTIQGSTHKRVSSKRRGAWKHRGQQGIDEQRAHEIQAALIQQKYLDGEPTGKWDQRTKDAMTRFQADHGWQTKVTPDSRALIVLGLGSKHENVLNPESLAAMPAVPNTAPSGAMPAHQR
jgi:peptidoglycan hydrolase-like protein with peptidoglycan-binding domain